MMLIQQISELVSDVNDAMTNGKAGTSLTLFNKSQTGLISGVSATNLSLLDKTISTSSISVSHVITTGLGNGNTLTEFEVTDGSSNYCRAVKSGLAKTALIEITTIFTFDFELIP